MHFIPKASFIYISKTKKKDILNLLENGNDNNEVFWNYGIVFKNNDGFGLFKDISPRTYQNETFELVINASVQEESTGSVMTVDMKTKIGKKFIQNMGLILLVVILGNIFMTKSVFSFDFLWNLLFSSVIIGLFLYYLPVMIFFNISIIELRKFLETKTGNKFILKN